MTLKSVELCLEGQFREWVRQRINKLVRLCVGLSLEAAERKIRTKLSLILNNSPHKSGAATELLYYPEVLFRALKGFSCW